MLSITLFINLRNSTEFDWYQNWENLRDIVSQFIKKDSKILNIGAGTSLSLKQAIRLLLKTCTKKGIEK